METIAGSKTTKTVLWIIGGVVVLLLAFGAGTLVGYRSGVFASRFGENYYRNFYGEASSGPAGMEAMLGGPPFMNQHGTVGIVMEVSSSSISAQDPGGNEESIAVATGTVIRKVNQTITIEEVSPGDHITVIGDPNGDGQILARFIRIFPSGPMPPTN
jgi:hypothetical protein